VASGATGRVGAAGTSHGGLGGKLAQDARGLADRRRAGDAWREQAKTQAELTRQTMQEGVQAWQPLWQPAERKPERA
jgi:hypothetical protein